MTLRTRFLMGAALLVAALASPLWGPLLLRQIPWFGVRRVEVSGTRMLAPHEVLAASGIRLGQNVWTDPSAWEQALLAHPAIVEARVTRRLPQTLRVRVEEKRPVAFVEAGALHPVTAAGELLPLDPTRAAVDLPIVHGPWPDTAAKPRTRPLLAELGRLAQLDPGLLAEVSTVRPGEAGPEELVLSHRLAEVIIPAGLDAGRLAQLRAVLADLERRVPPPAPTAAAARARVDLRYQDQIVVRIPSSGQRI